MATLTIDGRRVKVDDSFLSLSEDEQNNTVRSILASLQDEQEIPQSGTIADSLGQGAFFGFSDEIAGGLGASVNSAMNVFGRGTGDSWGEAYEGIRDAARENNAAFSYRNPKTAMTAEIAGGLATGVGGAARVGALKAGQGIGRTAALGAAEGGAYGIGSSDADTLSGLAKDGAKGAGLGAAIGAAVPAAAGYVGNRLSRSGDNIAASLNRSDDVVESQITARIAAGERLSDADISRIARETRATGNRYVDDVATLEDYGITLTTGQRTGSKPVKSFETTVDKTFAGGAVDSTMSRQREQLQTALLRMAGASDDIARSGKITDDALDEIGSRFSARYRQALGGRVVSLNDDFVDDLARVEAKHNRLLTPQQRREVRTLLDDFLNEATTSPLSGERYQALRSFVNTRARQTRLNNPRLAELFYDMTSALDDAFVRSTGESTRALNTQYAQYKQLQEIWRRNGGAGMASGDIPIASLNSLAKKRPSSDEWRRLINAASSVIGDTIPNSGTASRAANLLTAGTGFAPTFVLNHALARGVGGGVPQMTAQMLRGAGSGINSAGTAAGAYGGAGKLSMDRQAATIEALSKR